MQLCRRRRADAAGILGLLALAWGHLEEAGPRLGAQLLDPTRGPLATKGRFIVDKTGERVKWACVNWYGAYSTTHVVGGLEVQPMKIIVDRIRDLGFNCVRMMYSTEGYVTNPLVGDKFLKANPELQGKTFLELFDDTVQALTDAGLMVIINNHNSKSGWCCHFDQDEGLWYVPGYNESVWIESLVFFTKRYATNPLVVAIDLRNEVHDYKDTYLTWGDGNPLTDWARAATKAGNAVLEANPDVLIVVMALCFGMDLRPMKDAPVQLMYPNKVVYQVHNYLEYQITDNISKMLAPWRDIGALTLVCLFVVTVLLVILRYVWISGGRAAPPPGKLSLSFTLWSAWMSALATVVLLQSYNFGKRFCSSAMDMDLLPIVCGFGILSCLLFLLAAALVCGRRCRGSRPGARDASPGVLANEDLAALDERVFNEREPPMPAEGGPGAGKGGDAPPSGSGHEASVDGGPSEQCLRAGWSPCARQAYAVLKRDLRRGVAKLTAQKVPPPVVPEKLPWDRGMSVWLQTTIACSVLWAVLLGLLVLAHIVPTYWWMERHLDNLFGFALEEGNPYTAPVWMGEFGVHVRGIYWLNFIRYLSIRDVDFAYWALNGIKWTQGYIDAATGNFIEFNVPRWTNETFGILDWTYHDIRHTWLLLDIQALQPSPATWRPDAKPCPVEVDKSCRR